MYLVSLFKKSIFLGLPIALFVAVTITNQTSFAESNKKEAVTFAVGWFDIGKEALEGLEGIKKVEKGFYNSKEINTIYYDPSRISIKEMEDTLKKAGTYRGTLKEPIK